MPFDQSADSPNTPMEWTDGIAVGTSISPDTFLSPRLNQGKQAIRNYGGSGFKMRMRTCNVNVTLP